MSPGVLTRLSILHHPTKQPARESEASGPCWNRKIHLPLVLPCSAADSKTAAGGQPDESHRVRFHRFCWVERLGRSGASSYHVRPLTPSVALPARPRQKRPGVENGQRMRRLALNCRVTSGRTHTRQPRVHFRSVFAWVLVQAVRASHLLLCGPPGITCVCRHRMFVGTTVTIYLLLSFSSIVPLPSCSSSIWVDLTGHFVGNTPFEHHGGLRGQYSWNFPTRAHRGGPANEARRGAADRRFCVLRPPENVCMNSLRGRQLPNQPCVPCTGCVAKT